MWNTLRSITIIIQSLFVIVVIVLICSCENNEDDKFRYILEKSCNHESLDDQISTEVLPFLPYDIARSHIHDENVHSEILQDIFRIKKERYYNHFSPHAIAVKHKNYPDANQDLIDYLQILLWKGKEIEMTEDEYQQLILKIKNNKLRNYRDLFFLYQYVEILKNIRADQNRLNSTFASLHYLLHLIDSKPQFKQLHAFRDIVLDRLATVTSREHNEEEYREVLEKCLSNMSDSYKSSFRGLLVRSYMAESLDQDNFKSLLDSAQAMAHSPYEKHSINFNLGYYHSVQNDSLVHFYLREAIEAFDSASCSIERYYPAIYGLASDPDSTYEKYYWSVIHEANQCNNNVMDRIQFLLFNYLEPSMLDITEKQQVDTIIAVTRLAERLYPGKSTLHLQDYYISILTRLYEIVYKSNSKDRYVSELIEETLRFRSKEKFRKTISDNSTPRINELLRKINGFKKWLDPKDPLYEELFHLYLEQERQEVVRQNLDSISIMALREKIIKYDLSLLNIIKSMDYYYGYILEKDRFQIIKLPSKEIDSLGQGILTKVKKDENAKAYLQALQAIFQDFGLKKEVVLIPDGYLSLLPPKIIFHNCNISEYQNVSDYLHAQDSINIEAENIYIYSYSNESTIAERERKEVPELYFGLTECKEIADLLPAEQTIISGHEFSAAQLFNLRQADFIHLSTHASSSTVNRLDNYIVCRDKDGQIDRFYGYDICLRDYIPKVVVLSACETGVGKFDNGAGVETLSRILIDNGAQTVINTRWKVNDKATSILMKEMYKNWIQGHSLKRSLGLAQEAIQLDTSYSHPYYWAGFVLEGNPEVYLSPN